MSEGELRQWLDQVRRGVLPRRAFVGRLAALGLGAPVAGQLLLSAGIAQTRAPAAPPPARRGGTLRLLYWQGATLLNPHFATGSKDLDAARLFYEPLANWDDEGRLVPALAAELPSAANGGVAADGRSVVWKLRKGVSWHDGAPFTADDCVFTWQYASDPATAATSVGFFSGLRVEKIDSHTIRIVFERPTPFWAITFVGSGGEVLPRHVFAPYAGARSREAPANLKPVGTGAFRFVDFKPGDLLRGEAYPAYHRAGQPHFDRVEIKGGGDAVSAARAVLQTGDYDYAWNIQAEDEVLSRMEAGGKGRMQYRAGADVEFILFNFTDPRTEVDGERSSLKAPHPILGDARVRQALALLVDKASIARYIYGRAGVPTANYVDAPARFRSDRTSWEFNPAQAARLLDAAGWKPGAGGVREKDGRRLSLLFQTSTNAPRQKTQALVKQAALQAGVEIEIKAIAPAVFFSSDVGNPDTYGKFLADLQMYTGSGSIDPLRVMRRFLSSEASTKANKWSGVNHSRFRSADFDGLYRQAEAELDPVRRAALLIRMNELLLSQHTLVPVIQRRAAAAVARPLHAPTSAWSGDLAFLHDWHRSG